MAKQLSQQDWRKCIICQENRTEKLECPANSRKSNRGQGYISFLENIRTYNSLVPESNRYDLIEENTDNLVEVFMTNQAKWHKSCRSKFSSTKLRRLETKQERHESEGSPEICPDSGEEEELPTMRRKQSIRQPAQNKLELNRNRCMFCKSSESGTLHAVSTKEMHLNIKTSAEALRDDDMIAFLSDGDLIAQEAHYHKICHRRYTRSCNKIRQQQETAGDTVDMESSLAFAEVVSYLEENTDVVHRLSDLTKLYKGKCERTGSVEKYVHPTRFKERLIRVLPDLLSYPSGRDTLLSFNKNVSDLLGKSRREIADDDAVTLWQAAKIVRKDLANFNIPVSEFEFGCQDSAVPKSLLTLIKMLLLGSSSVEDVTKRHQESLTISQLVVANSVDHKGRETSSKRMPTSRETPLPLYIGVFLYSNTRSRKIVDTLFSLGLSVSYTRVLSVSSDIAAAVERRFEEDGVVCPVQLKKELFTTAAVDNIDYNPTSNTSKKSFHGTGISLFQHPHSHAEGTERPGLSTTSSYDNSPSVLSDFMNVGTEIPFGSKPVLTSTNCHVDFGREPSHLRAALDEESEWLERIASSDSETYIPTWPSYHAQKHPAGDQPPSINSILPLLENSANNISTIKHAMINLQNIIAFLNPKQVPVLVADQPLFALAKQIQWKWPERFREDKFVVVLGGLHIEMEFLKTLGTLLCGTGWSHVLSKAGICGAGTADSFLKVCHVKRTRYAHQVTVASLAVLKHEAYSSSLEEGSSDISKNEWCERRLAVSHQFFFWDLIMRLELITLCLVKSFRTGDFNSYVEILQAFLPFLFALNKTHYARWLPVHIRDMLALSSTAPEVHQQFVQGHFTVKKSSRPFSNISTDQAHEQNNETLKGSMNVISLMETPATLQRWMLSGPHFASMIHDFESDIPGLKEHHNNRHTDDSIAKQKKFSTDVMTMVEIFNSLGNPFMETSGLSIVNLETGETADDEIHESIRRLEASGTILCKEFIHQRLEERDSLVTDPLKKHKVTLMSSVTARHTKPRNDTISQLKDACGLFSKLYIACHRRGSDLDEFFAHENAPYPPALANDGYLRTSDNKSQLLPCLMAEVTNEITSSPPSSCIIYDGAVMVQLTKPNGLCTFKEYAHNVFIKRMMAVPKEVSRIDLVFDEYHKASLKATARIKRGCSATRKVSADLTVPKNWKEFLRNDHNKSELFKFLAKTIVDIVQDKHVVSTYGPEILSNTSCTATSETLFPCHQEEADGRMMLHASDAAKCGHGNITIRSVDTDVVILATAHYSNIAAEELWVAFGAGKSFRYIPIHEIVKVLGPEKTNGLLFFHAFTGCDSVSAFHGIGKRSAWAAWARCPEVTEAFTALSHTPQDVSSHHRQLLEKYTVQMYDKTCLSESVNEARKILFSQKGRAIDRIPPTSSALFQHMKRAAYQAGHIWATSITKATTIQSPLVWGWKTVDTGVQPFWSDKAEASKACQVLIKCSCKHGCQGSRCKCVKATLPCTDLCNCGGSCRI